MTKRAKRKKRLTPSESPVFSSPVHREDRAVLAVTVLWMLTFLSALGAEVGAAACWLTMRIWPVAAGAPDLRQALGFALWLAAVVTGVLCLALTPLAWWLRPLKPPLAVVVIAVLVGLAPMITLTLLNLFT